jgi:hypothetical protein
VNVAFWPAATVVFCGSVVMPAGTTTAVTVSVAALLVTVLLPPLPLPATTTRTCIPVCARLAVKL